GDHQIDFRADRDAVWIESVKRRRFRILRDQFHALIELGHFIGLRRGVVSGGALWPSRGCLMSPPRRYRSRRHVGPTVSGYPIFSVPNSSCRKPERNGSWKLKNFDFVRD